MPTPDPHFTDRSALVARGHFPERPVYDADEPSLHERAAQIDREDREDREWARIERDQEIADERADILRYGP